VAAVTYLSEERATELLTGQAGASGIDQADLAWLLATNIEAFLTNGDEPLSFERITACLGVLDALHQEVLLRVLRPFQDGSRGAGVDPLAESNAAALEALQDFMREKILRDLGIDPPGTASRARRPPSRCASRRLGMARTRGHSRPSRTPIGSTRTTRCRAPTARLGRRLDDTHDQP
jgi:hypothetical protein